MSRFDPGEHHGAELRISPGGIFCESGVVWRAGQGVYLQVAGNQCVPGGSMGDYQ